MSFKIDCSDTVQNLSAETIALMIKHLEITGYFFDETKGIETGSVMMEQCAEEIDRALRQHGYNGEPLICTAKYYPHHGAVYALFDPGRIDVGMVYKKLDKWTMPGN